jgi:flagellar basal-body rod protein FlgC
MQSFAISQSGMDAEHLRVEVAARNIANTHVATTPGQDTVRPLRVVTQSSPLSFAQVYHHHLSDPHLAGVTARLIEQPNAVPRRMHEPAHPLADTRGFVEYPGINALDEMLNLTRAVRAYEANIVAFNAAKAMATRALNIGGQS